jgi:hypothetical protein
MGVIILTVLIEGPSLPSDLKGSSTPFTFLESGFFEAVGVISFAYVCHHNTLLIYGSLMTPTLDRWNRVTHISMGISVASSLLMATSGYFIFVSALHTRSRHFILIVPLVQRPTKHAATSSTISLRIVSQHVHARSIVRSELTSTPQQTSGPT